MSSDDVMGKRQTDLFPPDVARAHDEKIERIFATGQAIVEDELLQFGTSEIWLCVDLIPLLNDAGRVTSVMGVCHDITGRKRAEQTLQQNREELEQSVEERTAELQQTNERLQVEIEQRRETGRLLRDSKQRMQMALEVGRSFAFDWEVANDQVTRSDNCSQILGLFGHEAVHDTGQKFFQRIHPEDRNRFVQMLGEVSPSTNTYHTEYRVTRGDGETIILEESARGIFNGDGKHCGSILAAEIQRGHLGPLHIPFIFDC